MEAKILAFMEDDDQTYLEFPPTLNSYERRLAHIFA